MTQPVNTFTPEKIGMTVALGIVPFGVSYVLGRMFPPGAWYNGLRKPCGMPPPWVFMVVWAILYPLLGISMALALFDKDRPVGWVLPLLNLGLSLLYVPVMFGMHSLFGGVVITFLCLALGIGTLWQFSVDKEYVAAGLMVPYVVWMLVAVYLAWSINSLNARECVSPTRSRRSRRSK